MKKLKLYFLFVFTLFILGGVDLVFAASYQDEFNDVARWIPNIYIAKEKDGIRSYRQMTMMERKKDGQFAYCIEVDTGANSSITMNGVDNNQASFSNLTEEEWMRISLIAYYGYGYGNHTDLKWYAISQVMIWQTIPKGYDIYFTEGLNGPKTDKYKKEMEEIESLIKMHDIKPSFDGKNYQLVLGESLELVDINSVLSLYDIENSSLINIKKGASSILVSANSIGKENVLLTKKDKNLSHPIIVYVDPLYQDIMVRGSYEEVVSNVQFEIIGGHVKIEKKDNESNIGLKNGVFGIFTNDGKKIDSITTNSDGFAESIILPSLGKYYLQEEKAPIGYKLDNQKYYFEITKDNLYPTISTKNEIIKGEVVLTKVLLSNQSGFMRPEVDAEFAIYNEKNELYQKITTDKNGKAKITLPYGIWEFRQLSSKYNYEKVKPFKVEIKDDEVQEFVLSDALVSGKLKVVKIDSLSGKQVHIPGISFKIINQETKKEVCQSITYPTVQVLCEYKTDDNGILVTPYPLPIGKYELIELDQKIDGYLWNKEKREFEIGNDTKFKENENGEKILEIYFSNTPVLGSVEVFKTGEKMVGANGEFNYSEVKLDNVCFSLYANEDIYSSDKILKYNKDSLINHVCTKDGYVKISNLDLGSYYLVETSTLDGFILDNKKHYFTLSYKDQYTSIINYSLTLKNELKKGVLDFRKEDFITGDVLPNTLIEVYTDLDEVIFSGRTDDEGKIVISNLGYGKYYILEKEAPSGYLLNKEKLYFEILEDGEIIKSIMKNEKIEEVPETDVNKESVLSPGILLYLSVALIKLFKIAF